MLMYNSRLFLYILLDITTIYDQIIVKEYIIGRYDGSWSSDKAPQAGTIGKIPTSSLCRDTHLLLSNFQAKKVIPKLKDRSN